MALKLHINPSDLIGLDFDNVMYLENELTKYLVELKKG